LINKGLLFVVVVADPAFPDAAPPPGAKNPAAGARPWPHHRPRADQPGGTFPCRRHGRALAWIDGERQAWSAWHRTIWDLGETAWREYLSADWYAERLAAAGFAVERGSGGMPTAFCAVCDNRPGPTIVGYAEYDGIPGNCQAADVVPRVRHGLSPHAGGHTDPHSALGIGALAGFLAAQSAMRRHGIGRRLKFFGEPAEKVRGSKPIHAYHSAARAPGANDAVVQMHLSGEALNEHVLSSGTSWSMNEAILNLGQAMAEHVIRALDHFAAAAAGLANHVLARATYDNLATVGAPRFDGEAVALANAIRANLGLPAVDRPFLPATEALIEPEAAEAELRRMLQPTQEHFASDDYAEFCWHAPTVRLHVGRPTLAPRPDGQGYPAWVMNALGGLSPCIDPMIDVAAKTIALTVVDLLTLPALLAAAREEFAWRTGGGVGGTKWLAPLCDYPPPIDFRWPEYVTPPRGRRE
jgi:metal-dependent amidase/aminoacylase/carboxypeptidase family protein